MRIYFLVILFTCSLTKAFSQRNYSNTFSKITITGTSNIHSWKSKSSKARVNMVMTLDSGEIKSIPYLNVEIPVKRIKSDEGEVMDNNTYAALKSEEFPTIIYKLEKVTRIVKRGDSYVISATGTLSVAGVVNKIDLTVIGKVNKDGSVNFSFSKKIKMSDYDIKLPTVLFGLIKTGNDVLVKCSLTVKQS